MKTTKLFPTTALLFILSLLFLISCAPSEPIAEENISDSNDSVVLPEQAEEVLEETAQEAEEVPLPSVPSAGECTERWRCISSSIKALQYANCSFGQRIECPLGCLNDSCRAATVCTAGFKCINEKRRGFQTEACSYTNVAECDWKCENGACIKRPANYTEGNETEAETDAASEESPPPPRPVLRIGDIATVAVNGEEHNLSIYILEPDKVRILLDGYRSDWISDGGNKTFPNGVNVIITGIYFQAYAGGKQEIEYQVD